MGIMHVLHFVYQTKIVVAMATEIVKKYAENPDPAITHKVYKLGSWDLACE